jgi:hypothetical protein
MRAQLRPDAEVKAVGDLGRLAMRAGDSRDSAGWRRAQKNACKCGGRFSDAPAGRRPQQWQAGCTCSTAGARSGVPEQAGSCEADSALGQGTGRFEGGGEQRKIRDVD